MQTVVCSGGFSEHLWNYSWRPGRIRCLSVCFEFPFHLNDSGPPAAGELLLLLNYYIDASQSSNL